MAQYKNIDIVPDESITRIHLSQGDIGRTLIFYLFENALSWSVPASSTIKCQGTKPSGFGFSVSCTYSGNTVTCVTTEEMTDEYGQIEAELVITSSDESQIFGTSNFILDIEKNPHPYGTVDGDAENPAIANLDAVITQATYNWINEHPEVTTTVVDGSITEPKLASALATKINNKADTSALTDEATTRANADTALSNQITALQGAVGSPLLASTVAGMTDTTKIYVYTGSETGYTSGNWYYYNGSSWVSGGAYNAVAVNTDTTLSVAGMPADAKTVGNGIGLISNALSDVKKYNIFQGITFVQGGFSSGSFDSATTRIRTSSYVDFSDYINETITIFVPSDMQWNLLFANSSGNPVSFDSSWRASGVSFTPNRQYPKIYLALRYPNNSAINPSRVQFPPVALINSGYIDTETAQSIANANYNQVYNYGWTNQSINNNVIISNTKRLLSKTYTVPVGTAIKIHANTGYYVNYYGINMNNEVKHTDSSWYTDSTDRTVVAKYNTYRFLVRRSDDGVMYPCEGINVTISFEKVEYRHSFGKFAGKKISILGDSISTFGGDVDSDPRYADGTYTYAGNHCRYPQHNLLLDVHQTYWMMLIDELGMTLGINDSWAGSRVSWDGTTESADIGANKYIASQTRIGHLGNNGTPDIIMVNAGTNDIGANVTLGTFDTTNPASYSVSDIANLPVNTFADAFRTLLIRLQYTYPNAQIIVLLPNYAGYSPTKEDEYCEVIKEACDYFGVVWADMRTSTINIYNRSTYMPDGTHYNADGMRKVFMNVCNYFLYQLI